MHRNGDTLSYSLGEVSACYFFKQDYSTPHNMHSCSFFMDIMEQVQKQFRRLLNEVKRASDVLACDVSNIDAENNF